MSSTLKAILGYNIVEGVSIEEYEAWLWDIHYPDLLANPFIDHVELNTVLRPITTTSAGTATAETPLVFDRIAELHFIDHEAYANYLNWFKENPIPRERSPEGRSEFVFYVLTEVKKAERPPS
ncbi:MAG: hypothetical protein E2O98_03830 [Acidobacteria bacterium]|nr:MAG: hypothetical protein E2O98_03830 [Acidobacteriota bacterium]TDI52869.1 MAG: hypothetical protein E2O97_01625 [Acidobacteriota bacterium]TDI56378.1 MAG: hypothetical protein E2O96_03150 [Acidobacteriota bacterium]